MHPSNHGEAESPAAPAGGAANLDARLDEHLARLPHLRELPLAEHAEFYERVHTELQGALADIQGS